jgi:hypothetical protein
MKLSTNFLKDYIDIELNNNKNTILSSLSSQGISVNDLNNYILNLSNSINNIKLQLSSFRTGKASLTDLTESLFLLFKFC